MKCPCEECLLIGMCKYKTYDELKQDCSIVFEYLLIGQGGSKITSHKERVKKVEESLKSKVWWLGGETDSGFQVINF